MDVLVHERLPPVTVYRKGPVPKLAFVGALASAAVVVGVLAPWAETSNALGERQIAGIDTSEGEVMLACAGIAALCFVLMIAMRSSLLMIPVVLSGALMLGLGITAVTDPGQLLADNGFPVLDLQPGWAIYAAVGGGGVALACAFLLGWDYRRR